MKNRALVYILFGAMSIGSLQPVYAEEEISEEESGEISEKVVESTESSKNACNFELPADLAEIKEDNKNLTISNNEDVRNLLYSTGKCGIDYAEFVEKNKDKTIEFDGFIFLMKNTVSKSGKEFKTRYDFSIRFGDSNNKEELGPVFVLSNYSRFDLNEKEENRIQENENIHIIVKLKGYDEELSVIFVEPISFSIREVENEMDDEIVSEKIEAEEDDKNE